MSLIQRNSKIVKTIGFKIAIGYLALFTFSFVALTVFAYLSLKSSMVRHERQMVRNEVESLEGIYQKGGWEAVYTTVAENDRYRKNNPFFTRVAKGPGKDAAVFFPQYWKDFDLTSLGNSPIWTPDDFMRLPNREGTYDLEILTVRHPDGSVLQVGISTQDRSVALYRFKESFLAVSIPLILLAVAGGALLANRVLLPLRNLIAVVESIEAGELDTRVNVTRTGDELDELGVHFNRMIDKINQLIQGMKDALDSVAHDLRGPMTRFRNIAETALQQSQSPAAYREALLECLVESDRILRMLHMLMDISEAETGTMKLHIRPVDLVQLVESIVDMYRYVAEEKDIVIETQFPGEARLEADADRICQVLANLLDNALKFTPQGGRVGVSIRNFSDQVMMQVTDTGVGIPPEEIQKIWGRLYRGVKATHRGLGLGLSLVHAVVHAHLGDVLVTSSPNAGSKFSVYLPVRSQKPIS